MCVLGSDHHKLRPRHCRRPDEVRADASGTGFVSWTDELALDRWRTGDVFGDDELPVLYAHGHYNEPEAMVLATTEYRRAYAGKLSAVLERMVDSGHLVWIGFSFSDHRISAILREVAEHAGSSKNPGMEPRNVAIMPWARPHRLDATADLLHRSSITPEPTFLLADSPVG